MSEIYIQRVVKEGFLIPVVYLLWEQERGPDGCCFQVLRGVFVKREDAEEQLEYMVRSGTILGHLKITEEPIKA